MAEWNMFCVLALLQEFFFWYWVAAFCWRCLFSIYRLRHLYFLFFRRRLTYKSYAHRMVWLLSLREWGLPWDVVRPLSVEWVQEDSKKEFSSFI